MLFFVHYSRSIAFGYAFRSFITRKIWIDVRWSCCENQINYNKNAQKPKKPCETVLAPKSKTQIYWEKELWFSVNEKSTKKKTINGFERSSRTTTEKRSTISRKYILTIMFHEMSYRYMHGSVHFACRLSFIQFHLQLFSVWFNFIFNFYHRFIVSRLTLLELFIWQYAHDQSD